MVITPLTLKELDSFFDESAIETINFYIAKAIFSQPELLIGQDRIPIQVTKEHIEQWIVQALGVTPVGSGSYPVDVIKENEWGADVKMLSCKMDEHGNFKAAESGETSLSQKFTGTGNDLDDLFKDKKYYDIIDGYKNIFYNKIQRVHKEKGLKKIYYFFILRAEMKFYLCGMSIDIDEIHNVTYLRNTKENVWTKNFLDTNYGSVRVYKAKKRMELRLRPKYWFDNSLLYEFKIEADVPHVNVRRMLSDKKEFKKYLLRLIKTNFSKHL